MAVPAGLFDLCQLSQECSGPVNGGEMTKNGPQGSKEDQLSNDDYQEESENWPEWQTSLMPQKHHNDKLLR